MCEIDKLQFCDGKFSSIAESKTEIKVKIIWYKLFFSRLEVQLMQYTSPTIIRIASVYFVWSYENLRASSPLGMFSKMDGSFAKKKKKRCHWKYFPLIVLTGTKSILQRSVFLFFYSSKIISHIRFLKSIRSSVLTE